MSGAELRSIARKSSSFEQIAAPGRSFFLHSDLIFSSENSVEATPSSPSVVYRRAVILASARRIIAEEGCAQIKMRTLAKLSGVSPPTIYALVGSRHDVVFSAIKEALERKFHMAEARATLDNSSPMVAFVVTILSALEADPAYYKHVIRGEQLGEIDRSTLSAIHMFIAQQFHACLVRMQKEGRIRKHSAIAMMTVARTLARQMGSTVSYWAQGEYSFRKMRSELIAALLLPVFALASERERTAMDAWFARNC